jgi:hypothetical protein
MRRGKVSSVTYGTKGGRIRVTTVRNKTAPVRTAEEVVRGIKSAQSSGDADYRDRSLALHGLICGRCGREFDAAHRH